MGSTVLRQPTATVLDFLTWIALLAQAQLPLLSIMALVLEPTSEELAGFTTSDDNRYHPLQAIFKWARFTWGVKYEHSPGAVLLTSLGSERIASPGADSTGPKAPTITMDEFASTPSEEFERNIESANWKFAKSSEPVVL